MYYTSTFAAAGSHLLADSSQLIDAMVIAQNEIDVTSIDGNRRKTPFERRMISRRGAESAEEKAFENLSSATSAPLREQFLHWT
jgi:hypothetical protein